MTVRHVFLDFFGTLVDYSPSRAPSRFSRTQRAMEGLGYGGPESAASALWTTAFNELDSATAQSMLEYSMDVVATRVLTEVFGYPPDVDAVDACAGAYLADWEQGVVVIPGMAAALETLSGHCVLTVVSNTHSAAMVRRQLERIGATASVSNLVTSVDVGYRKPHPAIYEEALRKAGATVDDVVFVGDTITADYLAPRALGMRSYLISSSPVDGVPGENCIDSVLALPAVLGLPA
jgi:putative hydrolase of the HAD superfamily